jgi:hypothetical protein
MIRNGGFGLCGCTVLQEIGVPDTSGWRDGDSLFASRLTPLLYGPLAEQAFAGGEILFRAVVQTVGFGLGMSKMLYLSTGID